MRGKTRVVESYDLRVGRAHASLDDLGSDLRNQKYRLTVILTEVGLTMKDQNATQMSALETLRVRVGSIQLVIKQLKSQRDAAGRQGGRPWRQHFDATAQQVRFARPTGAGSGCVLLS